MDGDLFPAVLNKDAACMIWYNSHEAKKVKTIYIHFCLSLSHLCRVCFKFELHSLLDLGYYGTVMMSSCPERSFRYHFAATCQMSV